MVTPDLCVAIFVYLDAGLLLTLRTGANLKAPAFLLGLTLGLGYSAKAILFPMGLFFIALAFLLSNNKRKIVVPLVMTFLIFGASRTAPRFAILEHGLAQL